MATQLNREKYFYIPYFEIIAWKYRKKHSKIYASVFGSVFRMCERNDGICFASVKDTLAPQIGVSDKQFGIVLNVIVADGLLQEIPNEGHSTNAYIVSTEAMEKLLQEYKQSQTIGESSKGVGREFLKPTEYLLQDVGTSTTKHNITEEFNIRREDDSDSQGSALTADAGASPFEGRKSYKQAKRPYRKPHNAESASKGKKLESAFLENPSMRDAGRSVFMHLEERALEVLQSGKLTAEAQEDFNHIYQQWKKQYFSDRLFLSKVNSYGGRVGLHWEW